MKLLYRHSCCGGEKGIRGIWRNAQAEPRLSVGVPITYSGSGNTTSLVFPTCDMIPAARQSALILMEFKFLVPSKYSTYRSRSNESQRRKGSGPCVVSEVIIINHSSYQICLYKKLSTECLMRGHFTSNSSQLRRKRGPSNSFDHKQTPFLRRTHSFQLSRSPFGIHSPVSLPGLVHSLRLCLSLNWIFQHP